MKNSLKKKQVSIDSTREMENSLKKKKVTITSPREMETRSLKNFSTRDMKDSLKKKKVSLHFSLMNLAFVIMGYFLIGILAYSYVLEGWSVIDSLYFTVVTFTTVGYGDVYATTGISKLFTCFFSLVGVSIIGFAIGTIANELLEKNAEQLDHFKNKLAKNMLKQFDIEEESPNENDPLVGSKSREKEVYVFYFIRELFKLSIFQIIPLFIVLYLGGYVIGRNEGWSYLEILYYVIVTSTSIGFGDYYPESEYERLYAVFFIIISVSTMAFLTGKVANILIEKKLKEFFDHMMSHELNVEDLEEMDFDHNGEVTMVEYMEFMLIKMEKVDRELLNQLRQQFQKLDVDNSGVLTKADLKSVMRARS